MGRLNETRPNMFGSTCDSGVAGVEIHLGGIFNIPQHHGTLEEVDMLHLVDDACCIVEILCRRLAVLSLDGINDVHRSPCRPKVRATSIQIQVIARILAIQRDVLGTLGQGLIHQGPRDQQSFILGIGTAGRRYPLNDRRQRISKADGLKRLKRCLMNPLHFLLGQRLITPALQTRTNRLFFFRYRCCP